MDKINIEITKDYVNIVFQENGVVVEKTGDISDFISILKNVNSKYISPTFPDSFKKMIRVNDYNIFFFYFPETTIYNYDHLGNSYDLKVPNTVLVAHCRDIGGGLFALERSSFYAIKDVWVSSEDFPIFFWPFPNQNPDILSNVCWGSNAAIEAFKTSCTVHNLASLYYIFFGSSGNNDYGWNIKSGIKGDMPDIFKNPAQFPYDELREIVVIDKNSGMAVPMTLSNLMIKLVGEEK